MIRTCRVTDLAGLLALYEELRPDDPPLAADMAIAILEPLLSDPRIRLIVAEVDGQLAATCQLGIVPTLTNEGRPFGIIEHVITAKRFRRRGFSQRVLEKALSLAWEQRCYKVMLLSGEGREAAHRLYEKLGFKAGIERGFVIKRPQENSVCPDV